MEWIIRRIIMKDIIKNIRDEEIKSKGKNEIKIILFEDKEGEMKTILLGNIKERSLYAIFEHKNHKDISIEIGVNLEDILEAREFLSELIEKIDRNKIIKNLEEI